ncbi:MAG: hypothetical protein KDC41_23615, partial [Saprospiraceae bacterium]|nr:hypothetical protein [Saprospiraceae bacterium]
ITGGVLFDLTVEPLPNVDNPADLTDDNTLPITFTGLSAEPGNDYDFLHTIFNAAGLFDRGRVQVVATNIRLAENEDCTLANVTGASTRIYPEPRLVDPADKTICSGDDTDLDLDLQGLPSANPATAGYPVRIDWTVVTTTNDGGISGASNGSVEIYGAGGLETAINDIVQTLVNTGSLPETATYTITPRAAANTPAYNGDDCIGLPIEVVVEVLPEPLAVATPASQTVCSDEPIGVVFSTSNNIVGTTFAWSITSMLPPGVTASALSGNGDISTLTITNLTGAAVTVDFEVTPTGPAPSECPGDPITFSVTVDPEPVATATPLNQFNCSEDPFNVAFGTSNGIVGTTFAW